MDRAATETLRTINYDILTEAEMDNVADYVEGLSMRLGFAANYIGDEAALIEDAGFAEGDEEARSVVDLVGALGFAVQRLRDRRRVLYEEERRVAIDGYRREQPALLYRLLTEPGFDAVATLSLPEDEVDYIIQENGVMAPFSGEDGAIKSAVLPVRPTWEGYAYAFHGVQALSLWCNRSAVSETARVCDARATTVQRLCDGVIEWTTLTDLGIDDSDLRNICTASAKYILSPSELQYETMEYARGLHMNVRGKWVGPQLLTRVWYLTETGARMKAISSARIAWWSAIIRAQAARTGLATPKRRRSSEARADS